MKYVVVTLTLMFCGSVSVMAQENTIPQSASIFDNDVVSTSFVQEQESLSDIAQPAVEAAAQQIDQVAPAPVAAPVAAPVEDTGSVFVPDSVYGESVISQPIDSGYAVDGAMPYDSGMAAYSVPMDAGVIQGDCGCNQPSFAPQAAPVFQAPVSVVAAPAVDSGCCGNTCAQPACNTCNSCNNARRRPVRGVLSRMRGRRCRCR